MLVLTFSSLMFLVTTIDDIAAMDALPAKRYCPPDWQLVFITAKASPNDILMSVANCVKSSFENIAPASGVKRYTGGFCSADSILILFNMLMASNEACFTVNTILSLLAVSIDGLGSQPINLVFCEICLYHVGFAIT